MRGRKSAVERDKTERDRGVMAGPSKIQEEKKQALRLYNILYNPIKKKKCSVKCRSINIMLYL